MHTTLLIRLVDSVKPRVNDYWQMSVDVEQANDLLSLSGSVDVQTWYASLFYRIQRPFNNFRIDSLPGWEPVVRRSVCGLNDEDVTLLGFCSLCRQGVYAVNVTSVQYRRVRSLYEELSCA